VTPARALTLRGALRTFCTEHHSPLLALGAGAQCCASFSTGFRQMYVRGSKRLTQQGTKKIMATAI